MCQSELFGYEPGACTDAKVTTLTPATQVKILRVLQEREIERLGGPTGYVGYWDLTALGVQCEVVAPTLVPTTAGDRVKTDRRDAEQLARSYRSGDVTAVWVPDAAHEALLRCWITVSPRNATRSSTWPSASCGSSRRLTRP